MKTAIPATLGAKDGSPGYESDGGLAATRPPPVITRPPLAGDYGTLVTVTGDNLDEATASLVLAGGVNPVIVKRPVNGTTSTPADVIKKWSKTEIQFKYPFPAEGSIRVTTKSGEAEGGSFVPSWIPGAPIKALFTRRELLEVVSPSGGTLLLRSMGPRDRTS